MNKFITLLICTLFFSVGMQSQEKTITIRVRDANNNPVAGAMILIDEVKQDLLTNANGVYKIKLHFTPKEISAFHPNIGIKKVPYTGNGNILIVIKKGNDISFVQETPKQKNLDSNQFNTIYDYLRGKVAGVNVTSDNVINIRGYSSINGNMTPLFVLNDNYVSQAVFASIIPMDIKSITVLKGPETTSYGIRGANGVIIVRTK